jgi:hypothetical protein
VGKDFHNLKRWTDIVLKNDAKGSIGLIGKYIKDSDLCNFLNSLDSDRIEIFCHGYNHSYFPFFVNKLFGRRKIINVEFDKTSKEHASSLKKYREMESKYLEKKAVCFGPPGNIWNDTAVQPLVDNDFKIMFSWRKTKHNLPIIPLKANYRYNSFKEFKNIYDKNKDDLIFTLQFHHAKLTDKQFKLLPEIIDFLKNKESRIFVTPSELLKISKKDKKIFELMAPEKLVNKK